MADKTTSAESSGAPIQASDLIRIARGGSNYKVTAAELLAGGYWTESSGKLYPTTLANNVGIGTNNPTKKLHVLGDVLVANATYPTQGLFSISETNGDIYIGDGNSGAHDVNGTQIHLQDSTQRIAITTIVPATVPTGTAGLYMGEGTGFGYAGFTCDYANDHKDKGSYVMGRGSSGASITVNDNNDTTGGIFAAIQATGSFTLVTLASATEMIKMDMAGGTGAGVWTIGNTAGANIQVDDTTDITTISGAGIKTSIGAMAATGTWRLGDIRLGAVVLDATQYIEAEVGGVVYKLCISQ